MKSREIQTIVVVELDDINLMGVRSFEDSNAGNAEAQDYFKEQIVKESNASEKQLEKAVRNRHFEWGSWQIFLTHSI